jgi:hypothetical protein
MTKSLPRRRRSPRDGDAGGRGAEPLSLCGPTPSRDLLPSLLVLRSFPLVVIPQHVTDPGSFSSSASLPSSIGHPSTRD